MTSLRNQSEVLISIIPPVLRIHFRVLLVVCRPRIGMRTRISYLKFGERQWEVVVVRRGVKILAYNDTGVINERSMVYGSPHLVVPL